MIILGIETSCDETALSLIKSEKEGEFEIRADFTHSQVDVHKEYGGVFPAIAKREHSRNLIPLLEKILMGSSLVSNSDLPTSEETLGKLEQLLNREPELLKQFLAYIPKIEKPPIDAIAVTKGPGLEPALWVGINFAKALSLVWNIPVVPMNHMEGHIVSALLGRNEFPNGNSQFSIAKPEFPALALLISGGHTELILIKDWFEYELLGKTRDDAVGEAFDKVARILGLPYPGGPQISRLAESVRRAISANKQLPMYDLPRPMLKTNDLDFSFSGLKTAVLYLTKELHELSENDRQAIAKEFEDAVTEILVEKTRRAIAATGARSLLVGGGVIANRHIRSELQKLAEMEGVKLYLPPNEATTDNALMIAAALLPKLEKRGLSQLQGDTLRAEGGLAVAPKVPAREEDGR